MTTKLIVYNEALSLLGERNLASLTEQREPRRALDDVWAMVLSYCIAQGMWNFAMRLATLSTPGAGSFGYANAFTKPVDLVHLFAIAGTPAFDPPVVFDFVDFGTSLHAGTNPIYITYLSNDATVGAGNLTNWPGAFEYFVAATLANYASARITGFRDPNLLGLSDRALIAALAVHSLEMLPGMVPMNMQARDHIASNNPARAPGLLPWGSYLRRMGPAEPQQQRGGN